MSKENDPIQGLDISDNLKATIGLFLNGPHHLISGDSSSIWEPALEAEDVVFFIDDRMREMEISASEGNHQLNELIEEFKTKKSDIYDFIYKNFVLPENETRESNADSINNLMNLLKQINN